MGKVTRDGLFKTVKYPQLTANGSTTQTSTQGASRGTFYVKSTPDVTLEFQGSALGGTDERDWVNLDEANRVFTHDGVVTKEGYKFTKMANFVRVKVSGVTGTADVTLVLGEG